MQRSAFGPVATTVWRSSTSATLASAAGPLIVLKNKSYSKIRAAKKKSAREIGGLGYGQGPAGLNPLCHKSFCNSADIKASLGRSLQSM